MKRTLIRLGLTLSFVAMTLSSVALAADDKDASGTIGGEVSGDVDHTGVCRQMALNLWGLSYHPDRTKGYNEHNWGAGFSCYTRPDIPWLLGRDRDNRLVIQGDAM